MIAADDPFDEALRLQELRELDLIGTPPEAELDRFVELAKLTADVDIALISLVDRERQWFKASTGLQAKETPRSQSFCGHAILLDRGVMWVEDATKDRRFADNPLVIGRPGIRFYAGAPITVRGSKIGTLCVIDHRPKPWNATLAAQLELLAAMLADRLIVRAYLRKQASALEKTPRAIIQASADGRVDVCNPVAARLLGVLPSALIGRPLHSLATSSDEQAQENKHYRLLVAEVVDYAIYMLDPEGVVTSWNAGARQIKGYAPEEIIGSNFSRFYTSEDRDAGLPQTALRLARATGRFEGEGWRVRKNGERLWASVVIEPIIDEGVFVGFVKITRDVTERYHADLVLRQALANAERANLAKSEFLANMSHEIRTPLNGVVAVADLLHRADLPSREREMAGIIVASAHNLQRLLDDILDLARIESGKVTLAPEPFHIEDAVASVSGMARLKAAEKGLKYTQVSTVPSDVWVTGDKLRIQQILTNLLSNAVKFTDAGEVGLYVKSMDASACDAIRLTFEVRDTGVGFDPAHKELVFGRFSQADGSITRRFGGSGLGLTISRELSELLGGNLDCDSVPGEGSVFTLTVEFAKCEAPEGSGVSASSEALDAAGAPLRVLLADDHPTNRKVCELILAQLNADVVSVENGQLAVHAFSTQVFDIVLMDMQMPVMDGLTAVRHIRGHEQATGAPRTPVMMLTANALPEHIQQGQAAGADHHIAKPITSAALFRALGEVMTTEDEADQTYAKANCG